MAAKLKFHFLNIERILKPSCASSSDRKETGKELPKEPLIWFKAPTSLLPDGGKIEIPFPEHRTDFEAELCIVIRSERNRKGIAKRAIDLVQSADVTVA